MQKILKIYMKLNPITHQNDHSPRACRFHPMDAGMVQYTEIHQCNPLHNQTQEKKNIILLEAEKPLAKYIILSC